MLGMAASQVPGLAACLSRKHVPILPPFLRSALRSKVRPGRRVSWKPDYRSMRVSSHVGGPSALTGQLAGTPSRHLQQGIELRNLGVAPRNPHLHLKACHWAATGLPLDLSRSGCCSSRRGGGYAALRHKVSVKPPPHCTQVAVHYKANYTTLLLRPVRLVPSHSGGCYTQLAYHL